MPRRRAGVPRRRAWRRRMSCSGRGSRTWRVRSMRSPRRCRCWRGWRSGRRRRRRPSRRGARTARPARRAGMTRPASRPVGRRRSVVVGSVRVRAGTAAGTTPIFRPVRRSTTYRRVSGCARAAARTTPRSGRRPASRSTGRFSWSVSCTAARHTGGPAAARSAGCWSPRRFPRRSARAGSPLGFWPGCWWRSSYWAAPCTASSPRWPTTGWIWPREPWPGCSPHARICWPRSPG